MQFTTLALLLSSVVAILATPIPQSGGVGESHGVGQGESHGVGRRLAAPDSPIDIVKNILHAHGIGRRLAARTSPLDIAKEILHAHGIGRRDSPIDIVKNILHAHGIGRRDATTGPANAKRAPDLIHDVTHVLESLVHRQVGGAPVTGSAPQTGGAPQTFAVRQVGSAPVTGSAPQTAATAHVTFIG